MEKRNHEKDLKIDEHYISPEAAEKKLRIARKTRQTVYMYGVTGCGKTMAMTAFLAKSRYLYFSAADTQAETVRETIKKKTDTGARKTESQKILVLDDLYLLEAQEDRTDFGKLIDEMSGRRDIWLVLISRAPVPKWLKEIYVRHFFLVISEEELNFTEKEMEQYFEKWELFITEESRKKLWEMTGGYALGLRIAAMHFKRISPEVKDRQSAEMEAIRKGQKDLWEYLGVYVYDQWSTEQQQFLEAMSIVDQFDLPMACQLTKNKNAGCLIRQAQEIGNFIIERITEEGSVYKIRNEMKKSMYRRLWMKYSEDYIRQLYCSAGSYYEIEGNMTEALRMYQCCQEKEGISRILISNMRKNPAEGNYFEWRKYYLILPEEKIRESIELMAGMSMLYSILMNIEESERWYKELCVYAKEATGGKKKEAESRLLYLDIALPHRGSKDMVGLLQHAGALLTRRKVILQELSVTSNLPSLMNGGKDFCQWSKKDQELAKKIGPVISFVLGKYGKGLVNLALAESFFEKGAENYEVFSLAGRGRMQAENGGKTELVFVAVGILSSLSVICNHMADAQDLVTAFRTIAEREKKKILPNLEAMQARLELYKGKNIMAEKWLAEAPDENVEFNTMDRYRYLTKVRVYLAMGQREKALMLLEKIQFYAEKMHRTYIAIETALLMAITYKRLGREEWKEKLQEAVTAAEEYGFVRILTKEGAALWELLKSDPVTWRKEAFRRQVRKECRQMADYYPSYLMEKQGEHVILSDKALKILKLQAEGLSVEQIAERMNLSRAGVKYYNQETYKKLGVNSKTAAVIEARNRRLI